MKIFIAQWQIMLPLSKSIHSWMSFFEAIHRVLLPFFFIVFVSAQSAYCLQIQDLYCPVSKDELITLLRNVDHELTQRRHEISQAVARLQSNNKATKRTKKTSLYSHRPCLSTPARLFLKDTSDDTDDLGNLLLYKKLILEAIHITDEGSLKKEHRILGTIHLYADNGLSSFVPSLQKYPIPLKSPQQLSRDILALLFVNRKKAAAISYLGTVYYGEKLRKSTCGKLIFHNKYLQFAYIDKEGVIQEPTFDDIGGATSVHLDTTQQKLIVDYGALGILTTELRALRENSSIIVGLPQVSPTKP